MQGDNKEQPPEISKSMPFVPMSEEEYIAEKNREDLERMKKVYASEPYDEKNSLHVFTIRKIAFDMSAYIINSCPYGRERSLALTQLQQTVNWACESLRIR